MRAIRRPGVCRGTAVLCLLLARAGAAEGQLPLAAAHAAEHLLEVARSGDRVRIQQMVEERFASDFLEYQPMEYHVPLLASLGRQVARLAVTSVELSDRRTPR